MRYPEFLHNGSTIGLIAPSFGVVDYPYEEQFDNALRKFKNLGYKIKTCGHLYGLNEKARSASAEIRAREFMEMYLDEEVDLIFSVAGGELMMEILPYINFEAISQAKPKYVVGYSDNTNLTFTLPILTDTAAVYGRCFGSFGMSRWHPSLQEAYEILCGKRNSQESYERYCSENLISQPGHALDSYNLDTPVIVKSLSGKDEHFQGRLIGGCLDVLAVLCGTPYAQIDSFLEKYKNDGFIWYLEACDLSVLDQMRAIWHLKEAGWLKYCNGIMYGRPCRNEPMYGITLEDALHDACKDIPVIYDMDFGHVEPAWTIISGSYAYVTKTGDRAKISFELR